MGKLSQKLVSAQNLPFRVGDLTLTEVQKTQVFSIMPTKGKSKTVSAALKKSLGLSLPSAGKSVEKEGITLTWFARNQYFLMGAKPPKLDAAVTDQSDGWVFFALSDNGVEDALARLVPLDFHSLKTGDCARSLLGHIPAHFTKTDFGVEISLFRSFSKTAVADLTESMNSVAGRNLISQE